MLLTVKNTAGEALNGRTLVTLRRVVGGYFEVHGVGVILDEAVEESAQQSR